MKKWTTSVDTRPMGLHQKSHFWYQAEFSEFLDLPSLPLRDLLLSVFYIEESVHRYHERLCLHWGFVFVRYRCILVLGATAVCPVCFKNGKVSVCLCFIILIHNQMRTYTDWAAYGQTISFISYHNVWKVCGSFEIFFVVVVKHSSVFTFCDQPHQQEKMKSGLPQTTYNQKNKSFQIL